MADGSTFPLVVVGDIGGTHARFALADVSRGKPRLQSPASYLCRDYESAEHAIRAYLDANGVRQHPDVAVIAVAGPVNGGEIHFTNMAWTISESKLRKALGASSVKLLNDYAALALAAPILNGGDTHVVGGPGSPQAGGSVAVLGAGTGFGVSALARDGANEAILVTEGGHIAFAPNDELEVEIWRVLARRFGRVSIERILSGPGLLDLYLALAEIGGEPAAWTSPEEVTGAANDGDPLAERTVERFCEVLGGAAGDFALAYGALGGVFIAGGIAPRLLKFIDRGGFRARFEAKGRFEAYVKPIPTRVITHPHAALLGAARALRVPALA